MGIISHRLHLTLSAPDGKVDDIQLMLGGGRGGERGREREGGRAQTPFPKSVDLNGALLWGQDRPRLWLDNRTVTQPTNGSDGWCHIPAERQPRCGSGLYLEHMKVPSYHNTLTLTGL
jgi:hypothetical protein